ncbi:MAG: MltA domain-containing protein [Pseudomonadota bacterium]
MRTAAAVYDRLAADMQLVAAPFDNLPGWEREDHRELVALLETHGSLSQSAVRHDARATLEQTFQLFRVSDADGVAVAGHLTGYFEPVLQGSRNRSDIYRYPVFGRPDELRDVASDADAMYFTRREIEDGALNGRGLELFWLADPVDCFFLHVQGSGRIHFDDGTMVDCAFAGKNGHAYTSIGKHLVAIGEIASEDISLETLRAWLTQRPDEARHVMQRNDSYIFFDLREVDPAEEALRTGPPGAAGIPLIPTRSLAVDADFHPLGRVMYVVSEPLGIARLMLAHDVGSAIRGPARGDVYCGTGDAAGRRAGAMNHAASFFVLLPREATG